MKKGIHPQFFEDAVILDNSSNTKFVIGSTVKDMTVEISSLTHPFYTGKQRIVDTDNLVEKFEKRRAKADNNAISQKKAKKVSRNRSSVTKVEEKQVLTLKDMLKQMR